MIGKLKGVLGEIKGNEGFIETSGGVFYKVYLTSEIINAHEIGSLIELYTHLQVKEDDLTLFGFDTYSSYYIFKILIGVDGVGPKLAYTIINSNSVEKIREAVINGDVNFFLSIKGVGKKTAQRILVDISGKFGDEVDFERIQTHPDDAEVIDAIMSLGFRKHEIMRVLPDVDRTLSLENKIRSVLQHLSKPTK